MPRRASSIAPLKLPPHDSQLIESRLEGCRRLASHRGQKRESDLDAKDELLTSYPFFLSMGYSEDAIPRNSASGFPQRRRMHLDPRESRLARPTRCRSCASRRACSRYCVLQEWRSYGFLMAALLSILGSFLMSWGQPKGRSLPDRYLKGTTA